MQSHTHAHRLYNPPDSGARGFFSNWLAASGSRGIQEYPSPSHSKWLLNCTGAIQGTPWFGVARAGVHMR